ncbi:MAG: lanthionine synthetase LanC family protein, partial [Chloroflexota bacterium]
LARGALRWCATPRLPFVDGRSENPSLCFGRSGVGMAWLHLAAATNDVAALGEAKAYGDRLVRTAPGPVVDFLGGAAGEGIFLVRLWEASHDGRFLDGAVRRAEWVRDQGVRDETGLHWPSRAGQSQSRWMPGFAHGDAGVAHFLVLLHQATGDAAWADLPREAAATLSSHAQPDQGGLNWPYLVGGSGPPVCQWCHGAPGVGLFYAKASEVLGDAAYLTTAKAAAETTFAYGDIRQNPTQCHGLAGNAELFIELYRLTHEPLWLERAHHFAIRVLHYRSATPEGDLWPADDPGYFSPDFMCGAAGTGHFFLRLWQPDQVRMPLQ